eukprot:SAG31_NODE_1250_length_9118_cov_4.047344_9_plen_75_part_00
MYRPLMTAGESAIDDRRLMSGAVSPVLQPPLCFPADEVGDRAGVPNPPEYMLVSAKKEQVVNSAARRPLPYVAG